MTWYQITVRINLQIDPNSNEKCWFNFKITYLNTNTMQNIQLILISYQFYETTEVKNWSRSQIFSVWKVFFWKKYFLKKVLKWWSFAVLNRLFTKFGLPQAKIIQNFYFNIEKIIDFFYDNPIFHRPPLLKITGHLSSKSQVTGNNPGWHVKNLQKCHIFNWHKITQIMKSII